jgi:AcrR family transcriptional regulator
MNNDRYRVNGLDSDRYQGREEAMARAKGAAGEVEARLREAAGRGFREGGFGGVGVDGLAREAGLTSGAFYGHFGSKAAAFRVAARDGLRALRAAVEAAQDRDGAAWLEPFVQMYLNDRVAVAMAEACALPVLSVDVARADPATRAEYATELRALADTVAAGLPGPDGPARAWTLLALLAGGATMARAVADEPLRAAIVAAVAGAARTA